MDPRLRGDDEQKNISKPPLISHYGSGYLPRHAQLPQDEGHFLGIFLQ